MSQAILILGMHRSGTSAVTRVCNVLGAELGQSVIAAGPDNPKGYWENQDIVDLHGEILRFINHPWDSVSTLPDHWWADKNLDWARASIRGIVEKHFAGKPLWAVKDPRMCLLLPLWLEVLGELEIDSKCLLVKREPEDIARSLAARDQYRPDHAYLLYIKHILEVEFRTRSCARAVISYDALLEDWYSEMQNISHKLKLQWPEALASGNIAVAAELDPGLRHQHQSTQSSSKRDQVHNEGRGELQQLAVELNLALKNMTEESDSSAFDGCAQKLARMESGASAWLDVIEYQTKFVLEHTKLEEIRTTQGAEIIKLNTLQLESRTELKKLDRLQQSQLKELKKLETIHKKDGKHIVKLGKEKEKLDESLALRTLENERFKLLVASQMEEIGGLNMEIAKLRLTVAEIYASSSWRMTAPLRSLVTGLLSIKEKVLGFSRAVFGSGMTIELFRTSWLKFRLLGIREFLRLLPMYLKSVKTYATRRVAPLVLKTPGTIRMLPTAGYSESLAGTDGKPRTLSELRLHPALTDDTKPIECTVSVIIPTYNAGEEFHWLLRKLVAQKNLQKLEIVVVDSGSTDNTVELARAAGCVVEEISQAQFSHSYARNLGADKAGSEFLLFIVQDAYPMGDLWAYGMLSYLQDHRDENVVAVSCSEYCRSDSDIMYDCNVDTHYRFLRCREFDRIGEFKGADHMSLRSWGQLSDVSCMISKELFSQYEYRGDYAEDLDLGIRLIRDNYRIAMLASVKTIHSHNRSAYYYLKRSFVDVIFLVRQFEDFHTPPVKSLRGVMFGIVALAENLTQTLKRFDFSSTSTTVDSSLQELITEVRAFELDRMSAGEIDLEDAQLSDYITGLRNDYLDDKPPKGEEHIVAQSFVEGFIGRLEHFRAFANKIYLQQDRVLREEFFGMLRKSFAATVGSYLGFLYLEMKDESSLNSEAVEQIKSVMGAGI